MSCGDTMKAAGLPWRVTETGSRRANDARPLIEHLADVSLRLNRHSSEAGLHQAIVDEVAVLLGAQRVLLVLVLQPGNASKHIAGARLPLVAMVGA